MQLDDIKKLNAAVHVLVNESKASKPLKPSTVAAIKALQDSVNKLCDKVAKEHPAKKAPKVKRLSKRVSLTIRGGKQLGET